MMNNVDFLSPYLPVGVTALGAFLDSAYTIDIEPYDPNFVGFRNETQEIYNRYNVSAIIPADCAAVYTGDEWKCTFGQYRMPFMKTPYVLIASNFDQYQLPYDIGMDPVNGTYTEDSANDYAMNWSNLTKSLLTDLSKYSYATNSYIHSWSCYNHDVSETSRYYQCTANGITQRIAVEKLLSFQSHGDVWIEECEGLFCGSGCDYLPTSLPTKQPSTHPVSKSPSQAPILKPTRHPTVTPASKKPSHHSTLIPISQSTVQVSVGTTKSLFKTDDIFTCVDFDYWPEDKCDFGSCQWLNNSVLSIDLSNPLLIDAVKSFGGNIRLRIGGTLADSVLYDIGSASSICQPFSSFNTSYRDGYAPFTGCLSMQRWDEINSFCIDVQCSLVFGINGLYGRTLPGPCPTETNCQISPYPDCCVNWTGKWDPSMTEDFFQYTLAKGYKIYAFEFGNELAGAKGMYDRILYVIIFILIPSCATIIMLILILILMLILMLILIFILILLYIVLYTCTICI